MTKKQSKKTTQTKEQVKKQKGFSALIGVIIVVVLGLGAAVGYYFYDQNTEVEVETENSNVAVETNTNVAVNQNTNASLPAFTTTCEVDSDCELRLECTEANCYNKNAEEVVYDCDKTLDPIVTDNLSCVCAERECTLVEDETADWQTYTNSEYGFALTFPQEWEGYSVSVEKDKSGQTYELDAITYDAISFTHPKNESDEGNPGQVSFVIIKMDENIDPSSFSSRHIMDVNEFQFVYSPSNAAAPDEMNDLWDQIDDIIATFSLLDETADWQTYSNVEENYSVLYPTDWTVYTLSDSFIQIIPEGYTGGTNVATARSFAIESVTTINENDVIVSGPEDKIINGLSAISQTEAGMVNYVSTYFSTSDGKYIKIYWPASFQDEFSEYQTILSTFQFTDQAAEVTGSKTESIDDTWNQYTNYDLGFSISVPVQAWFGDIGCEWLADQNSYRQTRGFAPMNVYENGSVYIAQEYFAELGDMSRTEDENGVYDTDYAECNIVETSVENLETERRGWEIKVATVNNEDELDDFINANFGSGGCHMQELEAWEYQDGVYQTRVQNDGLDWDESTCFINYASVILYYPAGNKAVTWDLGQAINFYAKDIMADTTVDENLGYDTRMTNSFRFLD